MVSKQRISNNIDTIVEIFSALPYEALTSTVNGLALIKVIVCGQGRGGKGGVLIILTGS